MQSIWEQWSNVHELLKKRTYVGKKCFLLFLGADFVVPKSGHRCEKQPVKAGLAIQEYQPKSKWKIHVQKKFVRYSHQIFYFLLFYISFYIRRYHFPQIFRTSFIQHYLKKVFFNGFTQSPLHPFNGQNPLSMMKVFLSVLPYFLWWPNFKRSWWH